MAWIQPARIAGSLGTVESLIRTAEIHCHRRLQPGWIFYDTRGRHQAFDRKRRRPLRHSQLDSRWAIQCHFPSPLPMTKSRINTITCARSWIKWGWKAYPSSRQINWMKRSCSGSTIILNGKFILSLRPWLLMQPIRSLFLVSLGMNLRPAKKARRWYISENGHIACPIPAIERIIKVPATKKPMKFLLLEDVLCRYAHRFFVGYDIIETTAFRLDTWCWFGYKWRCGWSADWGWEILEKTAERIGCTLGNRCRRQLPAHPFPK